jgi:ribose transport system ATP-binding protein
LSPLLQTHDISKRYPGVVALDHVDFDLNAGEIHCLVGENGAGKSTLMHILSGAISADEGRIQIAGDDVKLSSPRDARKFGIGIIHQDQKLVPELSVAENILLGNEPIRTRTRFVDTKELLQRSRELITQLGENIPVELPLRRLSTAQRQIVEIAKALSHRLRVLILDEPSAPLTTRETERLFTVLRTLRSEGVGIIYISHRLQEIFEIGDRVTVLRDGKLIDTAPMTDLDRDELITLMVGRSLEDEFPKRGPCTKEEMLKLEHVSSGRLHDINLTVHSGEIVGLAGLVGAGRTELAEVIFGARTKHGGTILFNGKVLDARSPQDAIAMGIGLLPEDRNRFGLIPRMKVYENISLSNLKSVFLNFQEERAVAAHYANQLFITPANVASPVQTLSGGNKQKVILARWLYTESCLFIFDEPTAGVDVGAKHEIYKLMNELVEQGCGILMISSDLPEVLGMCDRIAVMSEGRIAGVLLRAEATQERILALATPPAKGVTNAA